MVVVCSSSQRPSCPFYVNGAKWGGLHLKQPRKVRELEPLLHALVETKVWRFWREDRNDCFGGDNRIRRRLVRYCREENNPRKGII